MAAIASYRSSHRRSSRAWDTRNGIPRAGNLSVQGSTQSSPTGIYFTRWGYIVQIRFLWNHAPSRSPSPRAGAKWHKVLFEDGDILEELSDDLVFTEKVDGEASVFCRELSGSRSADFKNPKFNRKHFGKDKSKTIFTRCAAMAARLSAAPCARLLCI